MTTNAEILRRAVEDLWNPGLLDEYMEIYADDAELQPQARFPDLGTTVTGRAAIHQFFKGIHQPVTLREFQTTGDKVIVSFTWGTDPGGDGSPDWTLVYTFRDGKAVLAQYFTNRTHALCAAGLATAPSEV
ncbi:MAG TPA: nuclear transport factor 2 family protein [Acidimicrobiia bacterium]|jgi:ketosteroid isomerase-like protein|nr:nuclear transport factor 2 family protein [Acidimicrobiia bacterium]